MPTPRELLAARVRAALISAELDPARADVTQSADARFGDYQANAAMALAKEKRANPRDVAAHIISKLDVTGLSAPRDRRCRLYQFPLGKFLSLHRALRDGSG